MMPADSKLSPGSKQKADIAYYHADVSKAADCKQMVAFAEKTFGKLNVLFNNAGIMHNDDGDAIQPKSNLGP